MGPGSALTILMISVRYRSEIRRTADPVLRLEGDVINKFICLLIAEFALVANAAQLNHDCARGGSAVEVGTKDTFVHSLFENRNQVPVPAQVKVLKHAGNHRVPPSPYGKFRQDQQLLRRLLETHADVCEFGSQEIERRAPLRLAGSGC